MELVAGLARGDKQPGTKRLRDSTNNEEWTTDTVDGGLYALGWEAADENAETCSALEASRVGTMTYCDTCKQHWPKGLADLLP